MDSVDEPVQQPVLDEQVEDITFERPRNWRLAKQVAFGVGIALLILGPTLFVYFRPDDYTPAVDTLFSVLLTLLAYFFGRELELAKALQQANARWLPQAEAVTYRLITLYENVRKFSVKVGTSCARSHCDLPELADEKMRAVRVQMKADCDASADRLDDIANQLEDAIRDWQRFIAGNCTGDECARIFDALMERQLRMNSQLEQLKEASSGLLRNRGSTQETHGQ
jgi:hypothetical protein